MRFTQGSILAKVLFAAVTLLSFLPTSAMAEDGSGKFTLKHSVRWGSAVLAPGDYSYKVEHHASEMLLIRAANGQGGFIVMAESVSTIDTMQSDCLILHRDGNDWFVSSIVLSSIGETLHFAAPTSHPEVASTSTPSGLASLSKP